MFFPWICITVVAVWIAHGQAIRLNVNGPQGIAFSGGNLGREADCSNNANITCDDIWWLETSQFALDGDQFVSQGPQASVTFNFSGNEIYVYGIPSPDNGAIAIFTLDDLPPEPVDTSNVGQLGSDLTVLWSRQALDVRNHILSVSYDPQSREDGVVRYLFLDYFSYNDPSDVFSPPIPVSTGSPSSSTPPAPSRIVTVQPSKDGKFAPEDLEFTWKQYVAPEPTLVAVLSTAVVLLLFGTAISLCKRRRRRWKDALAPDPFINRGSTGAASFADSFSNSMYPRPQSDVDPIQAQRDFPPPPRPPPTVTSISYGDLIAETLSRTSSEDAKSSLYEPRGYRLHIPGRSYRRPSDNTPYYHT